MYAFLDKIFKRVLQKQKYHEKRNIYFLIFLALYVKSDETFCIVVS